MDNYRMPNTPTLVRSSIGSRAAERTRRKVVAKSSTTFSIGEFVQAADGTIAAPTLNEGGQDKYAVGQFTGYIVTGFFSGKNADLPITDDGDRQGTLIQSTDVKPYGYTFAADNDDLAGDSAKRELVELLPVYAGDVIEVSLFADDGLSTVSRGTTTAFGTTGSSANMHVGLAVEVDAPMGAQESSASTTLTGLDLFTVRVDDKYPDREDRVYVQLLRPATAIAAAIA